MIAVQHESVFTFCFLRWSEAKWPGIGLASIDPSLYVVTDSVPISYYLPRENLMFVGLGGGGGGGGVLGY